MRDVDFRLQYANRTMPPDKAIQLPVHLWESVQDGRTRSVRPYIPPDLIYVGTVEASADRCNDYYQSPSGELRQEGRRKDQQIIVSYRDKIRRDYGTKKNAQKSENDSVGMQSSSAYGTASDHHVDVYNDSQGGGTVGSSVTGSSAGEYARGQHEVRRDRAQGDERAKGGRFAMVPAK